MSKIFSKQKTLFEKIFSLLFSAGVQALFLYRISHIFACSRIFRKFRLHTLFYRLNQFFCNADISPTARLGNNIWLPHPGGIVIGGTSVIGDNVTIMQNVTLGTRRINSSKNRHPVIKNDVFIGANAVLLGNIKVGKGAVIGAGTIVLKDVPSNEKVFGVYK
ncbi:MAG: serine acetyltransferase [Candidatus Muiribacterium halophilum]|uniref:Serine acetyltransferase n=1 Tax=Muiribacterium halophilum TaxID=2053465 RepID=A0A2N5ZJ08_MUIH1|nr:MAG: serine acetyltransferase [Candidatus Muirbacterium halophilum]